MPVEVAAAGITAGATVATQTVTDAQKSIVSWLVRNYRYAKHIHKNKEKLRVAKDSLMATIRDIEEQQDPSNEMTHVCRINIARANNVVREIDGLMVEYGNRQRRSCCQLNKLGNRIVKTTSEATSMKEELEGITAMRDRRPQIHRWDQDVRIVNHSSLRKNVEELVGWLKGESSMKRICIWGCPGVGKTTTIKAVQRKLAESDHDFDFVFLVNVETEDIQEVIWQGLGKSMEENTNPRDRATEISRELSEKKYLLFLDGFSKVVNLNVRLEGVGFHSNHTQGKVVFACREKYDGETNEDMEICKLGMEDASQLFWEAVGSNENLVADIKKIAKQIIELCGGMPPLLNLTGKSLANQNQVLQWRRMKNDLQSPSKAPWDEWEEFYKSLKVVYDNLPADWHKPCLLYWSLFPLEREINQDYTIDCWAAEQFFESQRLWRARDTGRSVLDRFTRYSVLEKGKQLGHYKMFLCYQHAALRIANEERNDQYFAQHGEGMESDKWIQAKRVALAPMPNLPRTPNCNGLLTLSIQDNSLTEFPGRFFEGMPDLQVLCLLETAFRALPSSISKLRKLKGLILDSCNQLVQLPPGIGALQDLEILVVHRIEICSLPIEIGQLKNLRCLKISFKEAANPNQATAGDSTGIGCVNLKRRSEGKMFPGNVIKKLSKLEELTLDVSSTITAWNANADVIAKEITELKELTHLHFYFPNTGSFEHFIQNSKSWRENRRKFLSFSIFVGEDQNCLAPDFRVLECSAEKNFKFSGGDSFPAAVSNVLKQATSFKLIRRTTATNLNPVADASQELEVFTVEECNEILSIITRDANPAVTPASTSGDSQPSAFEYLKKLRIIKLPNLTSIWVGPIASKSFSVLTTLEIKESNVITKLFSREMTRQLPKLQNLLVEDCEMIKTIIEADRRDGLIAFENLKSLELCKLPQLSSVCDAALTCPSLEKIVINNCGLLRSLSDIIQNAPKLASIHCDETWWRDTQTCPQGVEEQRFNSLRRNLC